MDLQHVSPLPLGHRLESLTALRALTFHPRSRMFVLYKWHTLVLLVLGRVWVATVTIAVHDAAVSAVDHHIRFILLRDLNTSLTRVFLSPMLRDRLASPFLLNCPLLAITDDVYVLRHVDHPWRRFRVSRLTYYRTCFRPSRRRTNGRVQSAVGLGDEFHMKPRVG